MKIAKRELMTSLSAVEFMDWESASIAMDYLKIENPLNEKYKVVDWIFDPIEPVLYVIDKKIKPNEKVAYTKNQLQIVKESEERPPIELVKRNR